MGLSELVLTTYEDGGSVQVCANLLKGELGTNITLLIDSEAEFEIDSGMNLCDDCMAICRVKFSLQ